MSDEDRCGKRYGSRRHLVCRRFAGHPGRHMVRATVAELRTMVKR